MSQENVEVARAAINALSRGTSIPLSMTWLQTSSGLLAIARYGAWRLRPRSDAGVLGQLRRGWESLRFEAEEFIEAGDHVVTPITTHARGREGVEVRARGAWVWTFRDGSVARITFYQERQEALEALGLSE